MNTYVMTRCSNCSEAIVVSERGTIMAHGATNANEVIRRICLGEVLTSIAKDFCGYCGGKMPCGCDNPSPQNGLPSA